jgi:hypothetical protein
MHALESMVASRECLSAEANHELGRHDLAYSSKPPA